MANKLIIVAHPKIDSFSMAMANEYKNESLNQGHLVELIDLYRSEYQQPFFTFENQNNSEITPEIKYFQEKISWADEIIFVFPYWWGSAPAILHNFIDWNFSSGFAFEYINSRPKGLLVNKSVKIFTTTGAPKFIYTITGANRRLKNTFKQQIIEFCGMKLKSFNIFGGIDTKSKDIESVLAKVKESASKS